MSEIETKFKLPARHRSNQKNVWVEYAQLAADYQPLDLGLGFPDYPPPNFVTETLTQVARSDNIFLHQYTRDYGHPRLIAALAQLYSPLMNHQIDAQTEILITVGAYEALFCTIVGHVDEMDEVIIFEPFFDCYEPMVVMAGGIPRLIPLRLRRNFFGETPSSADWVLDRNELESLFNAKTKMIIVNNPHNPLGKVFKMEELEHIADLCKKWNVVCVSDEVYEWMVYKPNKHIKISTLPGMWERTITIGSAGKTFSVTGWKLGWAVAPANLLYNLQMVHQNSVYTGNTPMQEVVAIGIERELQKIGQEDCYFNSLATELRSKRDFMVKILREIGMKPTVPEAGYLMLADWSSFEPYVDLSGEIDKWKDYRFTKWMTKNLRLQAIPPTAFYTESHKHLGQDFVRFCFFKKDEKLQKAAEILKSWTSAINKAQTYTS